MTEQCGAPLTGAQMKLLRAAGLGDFEVVRDEWGGIGGASHFSLAFEDYRLPANHQAYTLLNAGWLDGRNVRLWNGMISDARLQGDLPQITDRTTPFRHTLADGEPLPEPVPSPVVPVFQTYHCVFRNGNLGAGYDTITLARENLGRRTRIDMRTIYSDGSIVWSENYYNV